MVTTNVFFHKKLHFGQRRSGQIELWHIHACCTCVNTVKKFVINIWLDAIFPFSCHLTFIFKILSFRAYIKNQWEAVWTRFLRTILSWKCPNSLLVDGFRLASFYQSRVSKEKFAQNQNWRTDTSEFFTALK